MPSYRTSRLVVAEPRTAEPSGPKPHESITVSAVPVGTPYSCHPTRRSATRPLAGRRGPRRITKSLVALPNSMPDENDEQSTEQNAAESSLGSLGPVANSQDMAILGHALAANDRDLASRYMVARRAGMSFGNDRDLYAVLGYNRDPRAEDYFTVYLRNHIARRIVEAPVKATWSSRPTIVDDANEGVEDDAVTEFEKAVEYLFDEHRLLHYLERCDKVTGIGEYGLLFMGLASNDSVGLDDDARNVSYSSVLDTKDATGPDDLAYFSTFSQARVSDLYEVDDPTDPRFGMPKAYDLTFGDSSSRTNRVHHSRVIHVAEDVLENEIYGRPRLEAVLNRLEDLEKVVGGASEMFWRGADRKFQLNYTGDGSPADADELAAQADDMVHGLRNTLQTSNVELNEIDGQDVDPSGLVEQILKLIAGETGIPLRILTGSERGELASSQDRATFYERIGERREQFAEPALLRPVLDRLIMYGILPEPDGGSYTVEWPELFELTELEQAELMEKRADALATAAPMGEVSQIATDGEIREKVLGWDPERGSETSLDTDEATDGVPDTDPDATDEDEADREAFEDLLDDLGHGSNEGGAAPARADGGTEAAGPDT